MKNVIPEFPLSIRDEILNYTDDKTHRSMIKAMDADTEVVILAGGKGCGKSFSFPCVAVYNMLQDKNYNCVICRNLKVDIKNTIRATFQQFLAFLAFKYKINLFKFFNIQLEEAIFKPTYQRIYFENFQKPGAFAGFTLPSPNAYIGDVFLDEIMQKRSNFSGVFSDNEIQLFYERQQDDMALLKSSTIYRRKNETGKRRHIYMSMNLWEPEHWVIKKYFNPIMPLGAQNYPELESKHYIFRESKEYNCTILRLSTLYIPDAEIDKETKLAIENWKNNNYPFYVCAVLGDAYLEPEINSNYLVREHIYAGKSQRIRNDLFMNPGELYLKDIEVIVDGYDPGLKDQNGLVRIALLNTGQVVVVNTQTFDVNKHAKYKRKDMCNFVLKRIQQQNAILSLDFSILAVDSKEDVLIELLAEEINKQQLNISVLKAIKNKNKNFNLDFNIRNRITFLKFLFRKKLIRFFPGTRKLLECLGQMSINEKGERNEKINPKIYDMINAFEYALSAIYKQVLMLNGATRNDLYGI